MGRTLGVREYAKHRGVTHAAVRKAIATGRLSRSVTKAANGWPRIDPDVADAEWEAATDPAQQRGAAAQTELFPDGRKKETRASPDGLAFTRARAVRENVNARIAELDLRERMGQLVDVAQVKADAFDVGRKARDAFQGIGSRLGPTLAGLEDSRACEVLLQNEVDGILLELIRDMTERAAGA